MKNKMSIDELYDHLLSQAVQTNINDMLRESRESGVSKELHAEAMEATNGQ